MFYLQFSYLSKLNLWNLANGKIVDRIEIPASYTIEDSLLLNEEWLLIFSNRANENEDLNKFCFIRGYQLNLKVFKYLLVKSNYY